MKLETLKKHAQQSTAYRGHKMRWSQPFGDATPQHWSQFGTCIHCGAEVMLVTNPAPNDIEIAGDAVALNCTI